MLFRQTAAEVEGDDADPDPEADAEDTAFPDVVDRAVDEPADEDACPGLLLDAAAEVGMLDVVLRMVDDELLSEELCGAEVEEERTEEDEAEADPPFAVGS